MSLLEYKAGDGATRTINSETVEGLRAQLRGSLCLPGEPGYEQARTIWNAMIDKHPALVVRAAGVNDVIRAVQFARAHGLLLSAIQLARSAVAPTFSGDRMTQVRDAMAQFQAAKAQLH